MMSLRKITALYSKNMKNIFYNPFIMTSPVAILLLAYLFGAFMIPDDAPVEIITYLLNMVVIMNAIMCGIMIMSVLIAEEKEKNTLNVLITSTVSGIDFLAGNVLTTTTITIICNIVIYFIFKVQNILPFGGYFLITSLGAIAAITFGATFGLLAKNQASASTMVAPMALLIIIPPLFRGNFFIDNVLYYFFTEQIGIALTELAQGQLSVLRIIIITANFTVFALIFGICYRKRGLA